MPRFIGVVGMTLLIMQPSPGLEMMPGEVKLATPNERGAKCIIGLQLSATPRRTLRQVKKLPAQLNGPHQIGAREIELPKATQDLKQRHVVADGFAQVPRAVVVGLHIVGRPSFGVDQRRTKCAKKRKLASVAIGVSGQGFDKLQSIFEMGDRFHVCEPPDRAVARFLPVNDGLLKTAG